MEKIIGKNLFDIYPTLTKENSTIHKVLKTGEPIFAFGFYAVPENFPDCIFTISLDFHRLHGFIDVTAGSHNASQTSERQSSAVIHARANGRIVAGSEVVTGRGAANVEAFDRFIVLV